MSTAAIDTKNVVPAVPLDTLPDSSDKRVPGQDPEADPSLAGTKVKKPVKKKTSEKRSSKGDIKADLEPIPDAAEVPSPTAPDSSPDVTTGPSDSTPNGSKSVPSAAADDFFPVSQVPETKKKNEDFPDVLPTNVDPDADKITINELNNYKRTYEKIIQEMQDRLSHEEDSAASLNQGKRKLEGDIQNLKKDLENVELALQKVSCSCFLCSY